MNKPEEVLREEIKNHPRSKVSRAYRLGQMEGIEKPEITPEEELPGDRATIVKKRGNYRVFSW